MSNLHGILYACEQNCYPRLVYWYAAICIDQQMSIRHS